METKLNRDQVLQGFLAEHKLPPGYLRLVNGWYAPLAEELGQHHIGANRPLVVGVNGSQGSGKSTLASLLGLLLSRVWQLKTVDISIDDFYLTRESRSHLADSVHPLLATRGVPGTHDIPLMEDVLQRLTRGAGEVSVPRFSKATDERYPVEQWEKLTAPLDVVIIEGWCLGTPAQTEEALAEPVNELEAREDADATWRRYVNEQISEYYQSIYQMVDIWIMLQAPSFDCVYQWRLEQEEKLADRFGNDVVSKAMADRLMSAEQIHRFIQHYQRLTEHTLKQLPSRVHYLFRLDPDRQIVAHSQPRPVNLQ